MKQFVFVMIENWFRTKFKTISDLLLEAQLVPHFYLIFKK